jgi:hypothetical protein
MALQKAKLYNADTAKEVVTFHFNPNELTVVQTNGWEKDPTSGSVLPDMKFTGVGARTLNLTGVVFDTYEQKTDVRVETDKVMSLMAVAPSTGNIARQNRPPHVEFGWGTFRSFSAIVTSVTQRFSLFLPDGTPVRAHLTINLQEVPRVAVQNSAEGQNPTSRAAGARRVRVVQTGDTIDWIAADELGDPTAWRILAAANGLDDPRRLRPGQRLFIPAES